MQLRFSIRDLFWFTVVIALSIGWWLDSDRIKKQRVALDKEKAEVEEKSADLDKLRDSVRMFLEQQSLKGGGR
jgi:hypothetical protein